MTDAAERHPANHFGRFLGENLFNKGNIPYTEFNEAIDREGKEEHQLHPRCIMGLRERYRPNSSPSKM